jgi:Tfp pilus assembly protein PilO
MAASAQGLNMNFGEILKKKDNVVIVLVAFVFLMMAKGIYQKQLNKYNKLKQDISSELEKSKSLDHIVSLNEKVKKLREKSWETADANMILEKILNLALENQIKIRDISPGDRKEDKNLVSIPFSINCEATFKNLYKFANKLETYPKLIRMTRVVASPLSAEGQGELVLKASLSLEAVYLK